MTVAEAATRLDVTRAHRSRILDGYAAVSAGMSRRLPARSAPRPASTQEIRHEPSIIAQPAVGRT